MRTKKLTIKALVSMIAALVLFACNKEGTVNELVVLADAYVITKKIDGENNSAVAFYVQGNSKLTSVSVIPPGNEGNPIILQPNDMSNLAFFHEPGKEDFNLTEPVNGNYQFEIESPGNGLIQQTDFLQRKDIAIPELISTSFNMSTLTLSIKWKAIPGADGIVVKLLNNQMQSVFVSYGISPSTAEFNIGTGGGNWLSSVNIGDDLTLQIQAFVFEADADDLNNVYNIEAIAVGEKDIKWGE